LKDYLIDMQAQGYTIVAVEQTINSENLYQFSFPEKTLLLLGFVGQSFRLANFDFLFSTLEMNVKEFELIFYHLSIRQSKFLKPVSFDR
jgi:hypothetical protein